MIQHYTKKNLLFFSIIFLTAAPLFSQQPGWRTVTDIDGNRFYVDMRGKIWTSGLPDREYHIVSSNGLDYYLNQGIELIKQRHIPEGLTLLKSVLSLPRDNDRIFHAQAQAASEINRLKRREGPRFQRYDVISSLLLTRTDTHVTITNSRMRYSLSIPYHVTVIKRTIRPRYNYRYSGILLGIDFKTPEPAVNGTRNNYDALLAIDSEEFKSKLLHCEIFKKHRENTLGRDMYSRSVVLSREDTLVYRLTADDSFNLQGYEGYFVRDRLGYLVRIVAPKKFPEEVEKNIIAFLEKFRY
jgi:hypothetical protein